MNFRLRRIVFRETERRRRLLWIAVFSLGASLTICAAQAAELAGENNETNPIEEGRATAQTVENWVNRYCQGGECSRSEQQEKRRFEEVEPRPEPEYGPFPEPLDDTYSPGPYADYDRPNPLADEPDRELPAETPRVAVIDARLFFDGGQVFDAAVVNAREVDSYAPKSFARDAGDWLVRVYGVRRYSNSPFQELYPGDRGIDEKLIYWYFIVNPGIGVEQEAPLSSDQAFEQILLEGPYDWRLVVPLYRGGYSFEPTRLLVTDVVNDADVIDWRFE